ncbi:A disintegrin and metalloproteinase with thrombospondin motifs 7 [Operophtera brumata]|uniref:A disintegrin and metalloproteinase with thrombospondin motifs 7 n=1 Tax=Operophtera brumata TaxID=104452 RepID=A0A0L7LS23_OPEBR|nr:A disintegrin and metalloproteinase with thrombospondin motifs 7 [Operophtera brumata]
MTDSAGHLRTENGEYWIEPSNQLPSDSSEGRPHVIFRRSAVDKVEAFHREKRAAENVNNGFQNHNRNNGYQTNSRNNGYQNNNRNQNSRRNADNRRSKIDTDKRRREFLERRRKRLEAMRRNPVEYRRQQANLRIEERRPHSNSTSNSIETSKSLEQSIERRNRKRIIDKDTEHRMRRIRNRRKRKRRNCATKQPPYQWRAQNIAEHKALRNNKNNRQRYHHGRPNERPQLEGTKRSTRSVSKPRHVEVLLVADKSMADFHNHGNLETYLLTIMNMVSSLYMDPSIGNYIKVVVVKIVLVEEIDAAKELQVSTNADSTLASFCRWQQRLNPGGDENPHHHDVAILVTRKDICSQHNSPCRYGLSRDI